MSRLHTRSREHYYCEHLGCLVFVAALRRCAERSAHDDHSSSVRLDTTAKPLQSFNPIHSVTESIILLSSPRLVAVRFTHTHQTQIWQTESSTTPSPNCTQSPRTILAMPHRSYHARNYNSSSSTHSYQLQRLPCSICMQRVKCSKPALSSPFAKRTQKHLPATFSNFNHSTLFPPLVGATPMIKETKARLPAYICYCCSAKATTQLSTPSSRLWN